MDPQTEEWLEAETTLNMSRLQLAEVPRSDEACRPYVGMLAPTVDYVVYGVLWCLLSLIALGLGAVLDGYLGVLFAVLIWIPYVSFVRRRRRHARTLLRDGGFIAGKVLDVSLTPGAVNVDLASLAASPDRSRIWYHVELEHGGRTSRVRCPFRGRQPSGKQVLVLFHPAVKYVLAFSYPTAPSVCRLDRR